MIISLTVIENIMKKHKKVTIQNILIIITIIIV